MLKAKENTRWFLYNLIVGFSFYWAANLLLWFPWSIDPYLGITLMLTVAPFLWGLGVYNCLVRYQGKNIMNGAIVNSLTLIIIAVILDYIFFGLIRGATKELYHPTTFYGYGFLISLPFIEIFIIRKLIIRNNRKIQTKDFIKTAILGIISLLILIAIIKFDKFTH